MDVERSGVPTRESLSQKTRFNGWPNGPVLHGVVVLADAIDSLVASFAESGREKAVRRRRGEDRLVILTVRCPWGR